MNYYAIKNAIIERMSCRQRIGWFDYSDFSWDMRIASARAMRIYRRIHGERLTLRQAMNY